MRERHEYPDGITFVTDGHLGGYVEGGDPNTTYPILWNALIRDHGIERVLDVGCGDGRGALSWFRDHGCTVVGIDGVPQDDPDVIEHDYTTGISEVVDEFDLAWSAEFVEHVEERYVMNFVEDFALATLVLMTHAVPGQSGWHHVNCRTSDYWRGVMATLGYQVDEILTDTCRALALLEPGVAPGANYFASTGLAFRRPR